MQFTTLAAGIFLITCALLFGLYLLVQKGQSGEKRVGKKKMMMSNLK